MTFLGHASRRVEEPPIALANRSDVTMVQKKRLALLAKMGLGPASSSKGGADRSPPRPVLRGAGMAVAEPGVLGGAAPPSAIQDRKTAMLERERRIREQEEREREQEEKEERERRAKRRAGGIKGLGPVEKREETLPPKVEAVFYPPPVAAGAPKMELKISTDIADKARASSAVAAEEDEDDDDSELENEDQPASASKLGQRIRPQTQQEPKKKGKKRKRRRKGDEDDDELEACEEEDEPQVEEGEEEAVLRMLREMRNAKDPSYNSLAEKTRAQARETGAIYKKMVVDSVKGKVSHAYKGFTDADLERRFGLPAPGMSTGSTVSSLMSEEQVLQMINKEKKERTSNPVATARRIEREKAEWLEKRKEHSARESQKNRERLVVSARK